MGIFFSILASLLLLNACAYLIQPSMVFFPQAKLDATPADWGLEYRTASLQTDDGVALHGWFIPKEGSQQVLLFFHGNAGNISHRGESVLIFHRLGLNVLIIDYRGYGASNGTPNELGLYLDAHAAWQYVTAKLGYRPSDVVLFGRSLGGVVAARLASEVSAPRGSRANPGALILESTLTSAKDVARKMLPLIGEMLVLRYRLDAVRSLRDVRCPVLVLHSPDDEIIPYRLGRKLFTAAPEPKRFVELAGSHNMGFLLSQPAYEHAIGDFIRSFAGGNR